MEERLAQLGEETPVAERKWHPNKNPALFFC
jgi:hypothetical protein